MPKKIVVDEQTLWDSEKEEFITIPGFSITIEHSLISISKWESKWHKPFLNGDTKSIEETLDYIKCMIVHSTLQDIKVINNLVYMPEAMREIQTYIEDPMTATTFNDTSQANSHRREIVTSELIYYWMIAYGIPVEFEKWHLNRLLTLIHICGIKNSPKKNMGINDIYSSNRRLNAARRHALGSRG